MQKQNYFRELDPAKKIQTKVSRHVLQMQKKSDERTCLAKWQARAGELIIS